MPASFPSSTRPACRTTIWTSPKAWAPRPAIRRRAAAINRSTEPGGWTINTIAPLPYSPYGLGGKFKGEPRWSYPSPWPGLHPSHEAAVPDQPGMVIGHTRLLGGWVQGKAGPMFCVNGNMGNMYLFTADGLFVSTLFHDSRTAAVLGRPGADAQHGPDRHLAARREFLAQHHRRLPTAGSI